jgi:hypothetical protein
MGISDVLFDAEDAIRSYQDKGLESHDDPRLALLLAIMRAVRFEPGRDSAPDAPDTFDLDIDRACSTYMPHRTRACA